MSILKLSPFSGSSLLSGQRVNILARHSRPSWFGSNLLSTSARIPEKMQGCLAKCKLQISKKSYFSLRMSLALCPEFLFAKSGTATPAVYPIFLIISVLQILTVSWEESPAPKLSPLSPGPPSSKPSTPLPQDVAGPFSHCHPIMLFPGVPGWLSGLGI